MKTSSVVCAAAIAGFGFLAASQIQPSAAYVARHPVVKCRQTGIHMTVGFDRKTYVLTSAIVCSNGKVKLGN